MQTHRDRGEPGGWGQQPAPSWTRGEGAGRGFALVLLPWVQPKEPRRTQPWLGGFSTGFCCRAGCLQGKEAQRSGGEALQGLHALHRGVCPKAGAGWLSCPLPGLDDFSEQIFLSTREGLCPCDCGQISAPGCCTPEAATCRSLRDAVSGGSFRSWLSI